MSLLKSPPRITVLALLISSLALSACGDSGTVAAPTAAAAPAVTVVTLKAEQVTVTRELPGRANASVIAEVRPQVSGIVKKRLFTEGGLVKAGAPLYQLDDATYRADHASAKASLARVQATLKSAQLNARRSSELVQIDAISKQEHEDASAALAQAEADVGVARAALERSKVVLGYASITSPISGRIGKSSVTQGALVTANQAAPLASVQRLDPMYVDLSQSSSELLQLRKDMQSGVLSKSGDLPVALALEDGTRYQHDGKLAFADVTVDPGTGSFAVRVTVPNPDGILLPGMYLRALVGSGVRKDAILVPQQGIARDPKGNTTAMVVGKDGKVEVRPVKVSSTIGDKWLVDSGLAAGDRVIVEGLQMVRPGALVAAAEKAAPAVKSSAAAKSAGAKS